MFEHDYIAYMNKTRVPRQKIRLAVGKWNFTPQGLEHQRGQYIVMEVITEGRLGHSTFDVRQWKGIAA